MENKKSFFLWHFKCLFVLLVISDATFSEKIVASTLAELRNSGWQLSGSNPSIVGKPSFWKSSLKPLDSGVTANETWRVTSTSSTKFRFSMSRNFCNFCRVKVYVRFFSELASFYIQPCEFESENLDCYGDPGNYTKVVWQEAMFTLNATEIKNGAEIEVSTIIMPSGGYAFFDQITIEHNGEACENITTTANPSTTELFSTNPTSTEIATYEPTTREPTTQEPTTLEPTTQEPTTSEFTTPDPTTSSPSTFETITFESTTVTDIRTTQPPECSTTPNPELCDCCDRCSSKVIQEIHNHYHGDGDNHHHYYYPVADALQNEK